jgi:hypothetical protein
MKRTEKNSLAPESKRYKEAGELTEKSERRRKRKENSQNWQVKLLIMHP